MHLTTGWIHGITRDDEQYSNHSASAFEQDQLYCFRACSSATRSFTNRMAKPMQSHLHKLGPCETWEAQDEFAVPILGGPTTKVYIKLHLHAPFTRSCRFSDSFTPKMRQHYLTTTWLSNSRLSYHI